MHVKYHKVTFLIKKQRKIKLRKVAMGLQMEEFGEKSVTVLLDRQKDKLRNSSTNPTYLFDNT